MKRNSRNVMALSASLSLVALTGCSGLMGGENVESAPALSEIDDLMWESMEEAGNVTITADMSALSEDEPQLAQIFELMGGGDLSETRIYGALDASASAMSLSDDDLYRSFGENDENSTYMSADALFNMLEDQSLGLSDEEQQAIDDIKGEFDDSWLDYTSQIQSGNGSRVFNVGVLFDELRDSWANGDDAEGTPVDREQFADEGTHEVRDEADVWVYAGQEEGEELVLEANHESPRFAACHRTRSPTADERVYR